MQNKITRFIVIIPPVILVVFGFFLLFVPIRSPLNVYDEGFAVLNASRVMHGEVPYRDFWTIYPPGQFFTLAFLFKLFGTSLIVARIFDTITRFVIAICLYLITKKFASVFFAFLVYFTSIILLAVAGSYSYAVLSALALILISILSLVKYSSSKKLRWALIAGTLIGVASFFRWDISLYAGISEVFTIFFFYIFGLNEENKTLKKKFTEASKVASVTFIGALIIVMIFYGYISINGGFTNLWEQLVIFPVTKLRSVRWKPYPSLIPSLSHFQVPSVFNVTSSSFYDWMLFYFPLFAYSSAIIVIIFLYFKKQFFRVPNCFGAINIISLGVLLFTQALSRFDYIHVLPTTLMVTPIVAFLFSHDIFQYIHKILRVILLTILTSVVVIYFALPFFDLLSNLKTYSPLVCYSHLERSSCTPLRDGQEMSINFLRTVTQDNEMIFVGNQRHDQIFVNDIGYYFLADRQPATFYTELHPGVATTMSVQEIIVNEIESKKVNWIVLVSFPDSSEPNGSSISSGVTFLDDYIRKNFSLIREFGYYHLFKKIQED